MHWFKSKISTVQNFNKNWQVLSNVIVGIIVLVSLTPFNVFSANPRKPVRPAKTERRVRPAVTNRQQISGAFPDSINDPVSLPAVAVEDKEFDTSIIGMDSLIIISADTVELVNTTEMDKLFADGTIMDSIPVDAKKVFVPDPIKAVWYSALCPGLGQIYNRRYWKLPIVIGGFMGLGYGASWNNSMLSDYTRAYYDLMDNDPSTKSYMDFFPPNTSEDSLNRTWLERTLKNRKDYFRRNRDLCIIGMVGVYLIAVVDAYVDASLTNFDISPDLSMQVVPALLQDQASPYPALGVQWAINF